MPLGRLATWIRHRLGLPDPPKSNAAHGSYTWALREISGEARHPSSTKPTTRDQQ
jgi:hypothetical protein